MEWDYGFDFYAPQTFITPNGRRIIIGWMGMGETAYTNSTIPFGWQHCLAIHRELTRLENVCSVMSFFRTSFTRRSVFAAPVL